MEPAANRPHGPTWSRGIPVLVQSMASALQPSRLLVALMIVLAVSGVGRVWDAAAPARPMGGPLLTPMADAPPTGPFEATLDQVAVSFVAMIRGVLTADVGVAGGAIGDLLVRTPRALWSDHPFCAAFMLIVLLAVVAYGGGALCRMSARHVARDERIGPHEAFAFVGANWIKLALAPSLPLLMAVFFGAIAGVLGLALLVPWLNVVAAVLFGIQIILGLLVAFVLLLYVAGGGLLVPAVACESCDAVDAQQRAYAFVINRPFHVAGYAVIGLVGLAVGYAVVALFAATTITAATELSGVFGTPAALSGFSPATTFDLSGAAVAAAPEAAHAQITAGIVAFWRGLVVALVVAWVLSYLSSVATTIYLLVRRSCDGQDLEEIWVPGLTPGTMSPLPAARVDQPLDPEEEADLIDVPPAAPPEGAGAAPEDAFVSSSDG